jgi:ubiquinone/menaquinone biosynthesis C-methylase UbiE
MYWKQDEISYLEKEIFSRILRDIESRKARKILVLCSAGGDVAFNIAEYMSERFDDNWKVIGMELDDELLDKSRDRARELPYIDNIAFMKSPMTEIPFKDETFDAIISEFIIYPSPKPTNISQGEMARALKKGGLHLVTDVIVAGPLDDNMRAIYKAAGLEYYCEATIEDFIYWMTTAGFEDIVVEDLTLIVRRVWEDRRRKVGGEVIEPLLDGELSLGRKLFYLYFKGKKQE